MNYNKDKYNNRDVRVELKDGRFIFTKNIRSEFFVEDKNGNVTPVTKSYYDKAMLLAL